MKVGKHSRSGLFLIELMISIAFFALTMAVFLQAFVKSRQISQQAEELFQAQKLASSIAEIVGGAGNAQKSGSDGLDVSLQENKERAGELFLWELQKYFPELESSESGAYIYYDEDWNICKEPDGVYMLAVSWQRDGQMWNVSIAAQKRKENVKASGDDKHTDIYQLALQLYCPDTGGGTT